MRANCFMRRSDLFSCETSQPLRISRRIFVRALAGLALAGAGGGLAACNPALAAISPSGVKLISYAGHLHGVYTVAWSPDGLSIASGGGDQTVQIWDALEGTTRTTYVRAYPTTSVSWSPDGQYLAAGGDDKKVVIRDNSTGKWVWTLENSGHIWGLKWSPDGKYLAVGGDKTVNVWNMQNGPQVPPLTYPGHKSFVWDLSWSPDGKYLASASEDTTVQVWDAKNGHLIFTYMRHSER